MHKIFENVHMGIGTWAWGDRLVWGYGQEYKESDLFAAFQACVENKVAFFDTAEIYAQGTGEKLLGQFIHQSQAFVRVSTKFMPFPWRLARNSLTWALRGSLRRLGLKRVDLYQIHQPLPPVNLESWANGLGDVYQAGLANAVGVSNFDRQQMQRAYDTLLRRGIPLASNQMEFHLLNRSVEKSGLLKHCQELGVKLIAYSPLAMGVLTGKYSPEHTPGGMRGRKFNTRMLQKIQPLISLMRTIGQEHNSRSPAQVALNWLICKGALPIPGAKTVGQAEQNSGALGWKLSEEEVAVLDSASDRAMSEDIV